MNDLEPLRKRAKHLVRQHRAGVHVVADRIRRSLPQYAGMTDREVLAADFALHDAQHLLAVELGFASWADLKEAPPMSSSTPTGERRFVRALACVFVTDFDRALAFYRDTLGFDVGLTYGEPPFFGEVHRDDAAFHLRYVDEHPWAGVDRDAEQLLAVTIATTDAKALFGQYDAAGIDFQMRLQQQPWQAVEFVVRDPDGNLIRFGSSTG